MDSVRTILVSSLEHAPHKKRRHIVAHHTVLDRADIMPGHDTIARHISPLAFDAAPYASPRVLLSEKTGK